MKQSLQHLGYKVKHTNVGTTVFGLSLKVTTQPDPDFDDI
jgi:hypothetical protein